MANRDRDKEHFDRVQSVLNTVLGVIFGVLIGGSIGLGICIWVIPVTLLFAGDTILAGAVVCGFGGYLYGEPFIDWLRENFWRFT
jgi:hypothetical protein